jgi:drug/metabolite transporter (DMT)-like permease
VAHLVLLATILVWSFSFLAAARVRQDLSLTQALAARFMPVLVGAGIALLVRRPLRLPRGSWRRIFALGLCGVVLYNVFFFIGLKDVPSGTAALIIGLNPVFTAALARLFLGEPFGWRKGLGLVLSLLGLFVVIRFGSDKAVDWPYLSAALLLALAPLSWAAYNVLGRSLPEGSDPFDATFALLFAGSLPLVPYADRAFFRALYDHPGALWAALYLAVPCTLFGFTAWIWALKRLPAGEVATFVFLNPPLALVWARLIEGAPLRPPFLLGAAVLLAGVFLIVRPGLRPVAYSPPLRSGGGG